MKAAVFKGAGKALQVEMVPDPAPGERGLLVEVSYCGICGTDLHSTREGPAMLPCDSVFLGPLWHGPALLGENFLPLQGDVLLHKHAAVVGGGLDDVGRQVLGQQLQQFQAGVVDVVRLAPRDEVDVDAIAFASDTRSAAVCFA